MTEQVEHSPGPWEFHTQPYGDRIPGGHDHSVQNDGCVIVLLDPPGHADDAFKANARLIAAAPDMLAALRFVVTDPCWPLLGSVTHDDVAAAIAKADGRTP